MAAVVVAHVHVFGDDAHLTDVRLEASGRRRVDSNHDAMRVNFRTTQVAEHRCCTANNRA